jgi:Phosphatidylinositol 3- and 4-kinase
VQEASTIARIQKGSGGAKAVFSESVVTNWLRGRCNSEEEMQDTVDNFIRSCAAYCVATYVLGIGDRHNGMWCAESCRERERDRVAERENYRERERDLKRGREFKRVQGSSRERESTREGESTREREREYKRVNLGELV